MLLLVGQADAVVEPGNTLRLAARLRAVGVPVTVVEYPGIDHMALMEALATSLAFLAPVRTASLGFIADRGILPRFSHAAPHRNPPRFAIAPANWELALVAAGPMVYGEPHWRSAKGSGGAPGCQGPRN